MFRQSGVAVLIVGILVLVPFVTASTADAWIDGIQDSESDNVLSGVASLDSIVACTVTLAVGYAPVVVALLPPVDEHPAVGGVRTALHPRAPPGS